MSCDTPRQDNISILTGQIFDTHPRMASRDLQTSQCFKRTISTRRATLVALSDVSLGANQSSIAD